MWQQCAILFPKKSIYACCKGFSFFLLPGCKISPKTGVIVDLLWETSDELWTGSCQHMNFEGGDKSFGERQMFKSTLQAITAFSLFSHNIKNGVNEFCALSVMALGPIVSSSSLTKHKVVRSEDLAIRSWPNTVHGTRLQVHEHCTRHITTPTGFIVIHVYSLQLQVWVSMVCPSWINPMLITYHLQQSKLVRIQHVDNSLICRIVTCDVLCFESCSLLQIVCHNSKGEDHLVHVIS